MSGDVAIGQAQVQFGEQTIAYSLTYAKRKTLSVTARPRPQRGGACA